MQSLINWLKAIRWPEINLILWLAMLGAVGTGTSSRGLIVIAVVGLSVAALVEHVIHPRRLDRGPQTPRTTTP